jgi:hypothetical protein
VLGLALSAAVWLLPPAVLPVPSRSGPEGPPRPYGAVPPFGGSPTHTDRKLARAQSRALRYGPFPRGGLVRGVSDGTLLLSADASVRALALTRIAQTGSTTVRIPVDWRTIVAGDPPATFQARDPTSTSYNFTRLDASVRSAVAAGLEPLLVVSHAPAFAEAPNRWPFAFPGSWAPSPAALEAFAEALARRYDGSFADPLHPGGALPRVDLFQGWNEPNLARYLEPQWVVSEGRWSAFSPLLYRELLDAFYRGVKSVQPSARVIAAGLAPDGDPAGVGRMAPVSFLRALLCLPANPRSKPPSCPEPARFDVLAFHPLSVGSPDAPADFSVDVAISDAAKVTRLLRAAQRLGTAQPAAVKPVWVTELNWESAPQSSSGVPPSRQAQWISRALHRLWVAGVSLVQWQFLIDPFPSLRAATPTGGGLEYKRPAGLYSAALDGNPQAATPKAFLRGFTFPFDPLRLDAGHVRIWGLTMRPSQPVLVQRRRAATWRTVARGRADRFGVLNFLVPLRGGATLRLKSGSLTSAAAVVSRYRGRG